MMKRLLFLMPLIIGLLLVGMVAGQSPSFELVRQIGRVPPTHVQYDPNFDQFALTDAGGRLLLVDAATYETKHVLYESGSYNAYAFSHDGRSLALAIDNRIEVWDTQTGTRDLDITMSVIGIAGPLLFSDDDTLLLFNAVVPAPDDIRRFENDTSNVPWIWELAAARRERTSILPEQVTAQPFFELRNGFLLGPNNRIVVAFPGAIEVKTITSDGFPTVSTIETLRYERDPMDIWYSLRGESIYFRPLDQSSLFQINTTEDTYINIPTGRELLAADIAAFGSLELSDEARIIGEPDTLRSNAFLRLLLGENYHANFGEHRLTVTLLDVLQPISVSRDQMGFLVYILDEQRGRGVLDFVRPPDVRQMALHPDGVHLAVRRMSGDQPIEVYNLHTGDLELSIVPAVPDFDGTQVLAYDASGEVLVNHWQRFDANTGELLRQDLTYQPGFEQFFFSADSQSLITQNGMTFREWDIATGEPIRTETLIARGNLLQASPDGRRYLYALTDEAGTPRQIEVVDLGLEERQMVTFEIPAGRLIEQVIPSPDWERYLVVYSANNYSPYYPGNEVALYSLREGQQWFLAGDDLPSPEGRSYGWLDEVTAYIASSNPYGRQPGRVYGLEYHPSGLPACLVERFPDDWTAWRDLWERLNARMTPEALGRLTQKLCAAAPEGIDAVEGVFNPTPTPTRPAMTPTPSFVAGLPACLSARFPSQAMQYAQEWRRLTEGLSPEEIVALQDYLCEGLDVPPPQMPFNDEPTMAVMLVDARTGQRSLGTFLPQPEYEDDARYLVLEEFRKTQGYTPDSAVLSPDKQYLAIRTPSGHVAVYRLVRPYSDMVAEIEATRIAAEANQPDTLALAPTATAPFEDVGQPRPTLTPTVTPTSPPPATEPAPMPQRGEVRELCTDTTLYTIDAPPAGYSAGGRLLAGRTGSAVVWVYDPATGIGRPDETLADAHTGVLSPDQSWLFRWGEEIIVSRPDGSDAEVLFEVEEAPVFPTSLDWLDGDTLEIVYQGYVPDYSVNPVTLIRQYDAPTHTLGAPFMPPPPIQINELDASIIAPQPGRGALVVVAVPFNAGLTTGYRYSIYDRETGIADTFARIPEGATIEAFWHPRGRALYYAYPESSDWYVFDANTRQHFVLGDLPYGVWSRDGRYTATWFLPSEAEIEQRIEERQPIPKLRVWDSETGLTRHYCIPETGTGYIDTALYWSPDNHYLAFQTVLPKDASSEVYYARTLILDTETGSVTELTFDINRIIVWTD